MPRLIPSVVAAALAVGGLATTAPAGAAPATAPVVPVAAPKADDKDYTELVNMFMSTQGDNGQNLPGAQVPHGLAKPNPMTSPGRTHSGYDYAQSNIKGFTLTNLDGVGGSGAGGDLLVVPTYTSYDARPNTSTYALPFSHEDETAEPGYYQVGLQSPQGTIDAELTATVRSGLERFTFPQAGQASLVLDLQNNFSGRLGSELTVKTLSDGRAELFGSVTGTFNGYNYKLYYDAVTSVPVTSVKTWGEGAAFGPVAKRTGVDAGAVMTFDVAAGQAVQLTTTLSPISVEQARRDQAAELTGKTFDDVRADAHDTWQETLAKVAVTSDATADPTGDIEKIFYTSLVRMLATPTNATSTDGTYRGVDGAVHRADGYTHYDGWGTWDDFRKFSVLATIDPDTYADVVQSLVDIYADAAKVGNATLSTRMMAVPTVRFERASIVVADAVSKGVHLDRLAAAFPALVANSTTYTSNNEALGYLPGDPGTTVAASYDDYGLSTIAAEIGLTDRAAAYKTRSGNYKNVMKPNSWTAADGTSVAVLSSRNATGGWASDDLEQFQAAGLYQGTLWQFHWYPAQDMAGLIEAMGGKAAAQQALSHYFGEQAPDDGTKMLKSNANEVDLQTPYLFNYLGQPAKTQKWVRDLYTKETWQHYIATGGTDGNNPPASNGKLTPPIKTKVFKNEPLGFLPTMDDDTGAMSATYVAAALGLYPVTAGSSQYQVGSPFFPRVDINHEDGTTFSIVADGVSPDRYYIQDATMDGATYGNTWVDYDDIAGEGVFDVTMGATASTWGESSAPAFSLSTAGAETPATASVTSDRATLPASTDGAVDGTINMTLQGATFAGADGDVLTANGRASVTGLPAGVTATVTRTSATTLAVKVSGALAAQAKVRFAVLLTDAALTGVAAEDVAGTGLSMRDPFAIVVTDHWRAQLRASFAEARLVVAGNWEGSTYAALVSARAAARTVLADTTSTDDEINDADATLTAALDGLALSQGGYRRLEAEKQDEWSGGSLGNETTGIGGVRPGSWIAFNGISFGDDQVPDKIDIRYSGASDDGYANAAVEVRLGSPTGELVAKVATPPTANTFGTYATATAELTNAAALLAAAPAKVYFVFTGSNPSTTDTALHWVGNFDYMQFGESGAGEEEPVDNDVVLVPEGRDSWGGDGVSVGSNTLKTETATGTNGSFTAIANTHNGDWVKWAAVDLSDSPSELKVHYINNSGRVAPDANIDVYLDSMTGTPLVNVPLPATGSSWSSDGYATVDLPATSGTHDVFIVMHGTYTADRPYIGNFGELTFVVPDAPSADGLKVEFEDRTAWTGSELKTESFSWNDGTSGTNVGGTHDGDVLEYDGLRFGDTATSISVHYVNNSSRCGNNSRIELYLDAREGAPVATVPLPVTGSAWSQAGTTTMTLPTTITGTHKVILVLRTDVPDSNHPFVSNLDSFTFNYGVDKTALQQAYDANVGALAQPERYVAPDYRVFAAAMATAQEVLASDVAIASEVTAALRNVQLAAGQLDPRAERSLMAAVADAQEVELTRYTQASADALTAELSEATALLTAGTATDEEYADQAAALESAISALVLKVTSVPDVPQTVSAVGVGQRVVVSWAAPAYDGNSPLTGYEVQLEGLDAEPVTVAADQTSYTFTGLVRGRSYRATVKAVNALGASPASDYTAYVPIATTLPGNPARPGIAAVGQAVTVTWAAPDDGGETITAYTVRLSDGTEAEALGTATSHTFTGVAPGDYTATVAATNVNGTSPFSAASATATVLPAPTVSRVVANAPSWSQVQVRWTTTGAERFVLRVALTRAGRVVASRQVWSDASSLRFTGLTGATSYAVSVTPVGATTPVTTTVRTPARPKVKAHAVQVKGVAKVRRTLTVNLHKGSWSPGTRFSYQWRVAGKVVGTGARLKLKPAFAGKKVTVRVTGKRGDWLPTSVTSKAVKVKR